MRFGDTVNLLMDERNRQDRKWGDQSGHRDEHWLAILTEEVGEVAKAMLGADGNGDISEADDEVTKELVQVAAVAIAWLEARKVPSG